MKQLKQGTRLAENWMSAYNESVNRYGLRTIYDVYNNPGPTIRNSYATLMYEARHREGFGCTVLSGTSFNYTFAYLYPDPETGEILLRVHTRDNIYEMSYV